MIRKKITPEELEVYLRKHKLWIMDDPAGERANLREANLYEANLYGANLYGADLYGANLNGANLYGANLNEANLNEANLYGANLRRANLREANLREANLNEANLRGADLYGANLYEANLRRANLNEANLRRANLYEANLRGANLYEATLYEANLNEANLNEANLALACPEKGSFTAFKKASNYIVELLIPEDAKRSSATSRKCRCSKAKVVAITKLSGGETDITEVSSGYYPDFIYRVGEIVEVKDFDDNRWNECAPGIHFFITRQEAVDY